MVLSISIFSRLSLSISIFFNSVDVLTIDISYRYIEQGYLRLTWYVDSPLHASVVILHLYATSPCCIISSHSLSSLVYWINELITAFIRPPLQRLCGHNSNMLHSENFQELIRQFLDTETDAAYWISISQLHFCEWQSPSWLGLCKRKQLLLFPTIKNLFALEMDIDDPSYRDITTQTNRPLDKVTISVWTCLLRSIIMKGCTRLLCAKLFKLQSIWI